MNTTWDEDVRRWVIDQIREDNCRFPHTFRASPQLLGRTVLTELTTKIT